MAAPLFLSYRWEEGEPPSNVVVLDRELRLRGVPMWRDVRDLIAGALNEDVARRALTDECCGCVLYFTEDVLDSWFISSVELEAVRRRLDRDQDFFIAAVFDGVGEEESEKLRELTGVDVRSFQGLVLDSSAVPEDQLREFSASLLRRYLGLQGGDDLSVKADSWNAISWTDEAIFHLNWAGEDGGDGLLPARWSLLKLAVADVRRALDEVGERNLTLSGNLHLGSAFLLGWEFRETTGWAISAAHSRAAFTSALVAPDPQGWAIVTRPAQNDSTVLVARVCASADPSHAVRTHRQGEPAARAELTVFPPDGGSHRTSMEGVDINGLAAAIVEAVRAARGEFGVTATDLYLACPWTLALAIGWNFASSGPVVVHEATADKSTYHPDPLPIQ